MEDTNRVYRIRTVVGDDAPNVIHVPLKQSYDMFEILSLKLDQTNTYKTYESDYGVIVGRVTANGGFGVPNAKVSIFIDVSDEETLKNRFLYNYSSTSDTNGDGVRYNVLPDFVDDACHQDVGTFPNKRLVLDNKDEIEIFDKYWKYTTTTNYAGDYMLFGIPTGSQQLHVDVDLSDCGILSQRPRDMIGKGYNANMFESPNKFKFSANLNSLAQIISQDRGIYVYPYWGDVSDGDDKFSITRCDINLEYKFESYAVFIGSIVTDKGSNAIGKNCTGTEQNGKMSDLIAGEGKIEMIRKTLDGKVEEFPIMGNRLIDGDGVWCYQIPMNLDYVTTDEFGNLVPTDNPDKGIATRTRVRFRISLDENPNDATARKRARYLVPNNPRMGEGSFDDELDADYEFGSATREESYCDMFWNKVYTVKNYIPKLQKNNKETNRKHTGIKLINHYGDNNPMPYNALTIKLSFVYRIICIITKVVINLIEFINEIISIIGAILCLIIKILEFPAQIFEKYMCFKIPVINKRICPFKWLGKLWRSMMSPITKLIYMIMPNCIGLSSEFCDDGINQVTYYPGCGYFLFSLFKMKSIGLDCVWEETAKNHTKNQLKICENEKKTKEECEMSLTTPSNKTAMLYNCVENQLAQQNDATSFNFYNDWVNGVLYAPLWYRKITPKKRFFFGLFKRKAKDDWCSSQREYPGMRILQHCTVSRETDGQYQNFDGENVDYKRVINYRCDSKCHKKYTEVKGMNGVIIPKQTMLDQTVYYYKAIEYDASLPKNPLYHGTKNGDIKLLFATDIVLLGSLNECDLNGIPQFFKSLESTTYDLPTDILFTDYDFILTVSEETGEAERMEYTITDLVKTSEMAGCDWGNPNEFDKYDGGLFYSIGCSSGSIKLDTKSCINLSRICEYGVSLDETKEVADLEQINNEMPTDEQIDVDTRYFQRLITDGFVSWDELYNLDERSMFATMNGNKLQTKLNTNNGLKEYDFRYLYPENFDGSLKEIMQKRTERYSSEINYRNNFKLEEKSRDYYVFRMGNKPYYYDSDKENGYSFPRYENSFYFYFGLKAGKTAIEKFNSKYFAECVNPEDIQSQIGIKYEPNGWCSDTNDGYLALDLTNISTPYDLLINGVNDLTFSLEIKNIEEEKIYFSNVQKTDLESNGYVWAKVDSDNNFDMNGTFVPMLKNGSYQGTVTDSDGNNSDFVFNINNEYLSFKLNTQNFEQPNNVLLPRFNNCHKTIASYSSDLVTSDIENIKRTEIGGVITVYAIFMNGEPLDEYRINIVPIKNGQAIEIGSGQCSYKGASLEYSNGAVTKETDGASTILYAQNHHYGFGLPLGNQEYRITITQLCSGVDSDNVVYKDVYVEEPMPYKMFINSVDYDVIKNFDNKTGWNLSGTVSSPNASESTISLSWEWFNIDKIYSTQYIGGVEIKDVQNFIVEKDYDNMAFKIYATTDGNDRHECSVQELKNEFCVVGVHGTPYNWVDKYVTEGYDTVDYDNVDGFVNSLNETLTNRRELLDMMKDTFYLYCKEDSKDIVVRGQTDKLPCTQTIVYHPEKAVEFENRNVLDGNNLISEDSDVNGGQVTDIMIPTISYKSSPYYGTGEESDEPCLVTVQDNVNKNIFNTKKPYSVGIMNYSGMSIPTKSNGDSFAYTERDGAKYISGSTQLNDLFSFPIIDMILNDDYIAWAAMVAMPKYKPSAPELVTMNGVLAGIIYNGKTINDKFYKQTFNSVDLVLTDNIASGGTYIEKRIIIGNNDNGCFTNYIVENGQGNKQYASVYPIESFFTVQDDNGCGVEQLIQGDLVITLSENSVNNCKTGEKVFELVPDDNICYSVFNVRNNTYPLNRANQNGSLWYINDTVYGLYSSAPQNLFSFQMKTKHLRGEGGMIDTNFVSQTLISGDAEEEVYETTRGYGTTGIFEVPSFSYPIFVVGETDTHVRILSPVYDYSNVSARLQFGLMQHSETIEDGVDEETGEPILIEDITEDYKFGIAVNPGHYYLDNYPYKLSGIVKMDEQNVIVLNEEVLIGSEKYIFATISELMYKTLKAMSENGTISRLAATSTITAIDYTGLKHICGVSGISETTWEDPVPTQEYTVTWVDNG